MYLTDITNFIVWFQQQFVSLISRCLSILNSFSFQGFTLLGFILTLGLLHIAINLFILTSKAKPTEKSNKGGK